MMQIATSCACSISLSCFMSEDNSNKKIVSAFCLFTLTPVFKPVYILVKNYAHKRGYLTCLLFQGFYKLKSLKHIFWLKFTMNGSF